MQGFFHEHLRPLAGSAVLHLALVGVLALAALRWSTSQPPVELAIEGYFVDGPVATKRLPDPRASAAPTTPAPAVAPAVAEPPPPPKPVAEPPEERRVEDVAAAERAAEAARERKQVEERAEAEREAQQAKEHAAEQQRQAEAAERKRAADAELKRKAAEDLERKQAEAAEAKRKAAAQAQAERDTKLKAEREAALQRALAEEEEGAAVARSGVVDEYRALLVQTIERNWMRPPSARAGLQCTLYVTQAPGGTVVDVKLGACNGDQAVRESITTAVYRASPLPAPRDPRAFERRLEIVFKPTE
jgi:colicin import membrane protein